MAPVIVAGEDNTSGGQIEATTTSKRESPTDSFNTYHTCPLQSNCVNNSQTSAESCHHLHRKVSFEDNIVVVVVDLIHGIFSQINRAIRNWWRKLPENKRRAFFAWLLKHKWKLALPILAAVVAFFTYYTSHLELTPITNRSRFIAFTHDQFKMLNQIELEAQLAQYKSKLLPNNHPITRRVATIAKQLLDRNKDIDTIAELEWTVSVIDDLNVMNAFVLASGNIFVFSGLLNICDNNDQLGMVLST